MKAALLLLAIGLLGIAAVWWYLTPAPGRKLFRGSAVVVKDITTQPRPKGKGAVAGSPKPVKRDVARAPEKNPEPSHNPAERNQSPPPPPRPVSFPFPTLGEVKIGTDRAQVINEFGPPALSA